MVSALKAPRVNFLKACELLAVIHSKEIWKKVPGAEGKLFQSFGAYFSQALGLDRTVAYHMIAIGREVLPKTRKAGIEDGVLEVMPRERLHILSSMLRTSRNPNATRHRVAFLRDQSMEVLHDEYGLGRVRRAIENVLRSLTYSVVAEDGDSATVMATMPRTLWEQIKGKLKIIQIAA